MTIWLRSDTAKLAEIAGRVGLSPEESLRAITIGAKFITMGYSDDSIRDMEWVYREMRRKAWDRWEQGGSSSTSSNVNDCPQGVWGDD